MIRRFGGALVHELKRALCTRGIGEFRFRRRLARTGIVDFGMFRLAIDPFDAGGVQYSTGVLGRADLARGTGDCARFNPVLFVDVGANYGFTALVHHHLNPTCRIVAIEPSPQSPGI